MAQVVIFTDITQIAWSRTAGPYRLATSLRRQGYNTQVVEHFLWSAITNLNLVRDTIDKLVSSNTLVVGFSITFFQASILKSESYKLKNLGFDINTDIIDELGAVPLSRSVLENIRNWIRHKNPKTKIVIGGASRVKLNLTGTIFDAQVVGFADQAFPDYVRYLDGKNAFFQLGNGIIDHDAVASSLDVNTATIEWTAQDLIVSGERLPIEISRGCIFKCDFCAYALNGKKKLDYVKSVEVLDHELKRNYDKWGTTDYWFSDDTFNDTEEKVVAITSMLKRLPFKITYRAYLRLDLLSAHKYLVTHLVESGLTMAMFGVESLNGANTKLVGKGMSPERAIKFLNELWNDEGWDTKVLVLVCLIVGLPHDSKDNLAWLDTALSDDFKADWINLNPLYLTKNPSEINSSQFEREASKYGYKFTDSEWEWSNSNTGLTFNDCKQIVFETIRKPSSKNSTGTLHEMYKGMSKLSLNELCRSIGGKAEVPRYLFNQRLRLMDDYFKRLKVI